MELFKFSIMTLNNSVIIIKAIANKFQNGPKIPLIYLLKSFLNQNILGKKLEISDVVKENFNYSLNKYKKKVRNYIKKAIYFPMMQVNWKEVNINI